MTSFLDSWVTFLERLSDIQLGEKKVTLIHLVYNILSLDLVLNPPRSNKTEAVLGEFRKSFNPTRLALGGISNNLEPMSERCSCEFCHSFTYPDAPCREYLLTFPLDCGHFAQNVCKYSIHSEHQGYSAIMCVGMKKPKCCVNFGRHWDCGPANLAACLNHWIFCSKKGSFKKLNDQLVGGFNPNWKILVKLEIFPKEGWTTT